MVFSGNFEKLTKDYKTGKISLVITIDDADVNRLSEILESDVDVRIEKHRSRRSRNSNAFFHSLAQQVAEAAGISKAHAKNMLVTRYGQPMLTDQGDFVTWETELDVQTVQELDSHHAIPIDYKGNTTVYKLYRGTHTYNSKEMSILIDGAISELEEMGIKVSKMAPL